MYNLLCRTVAVSLRKFVSIECVLRYVTESIILPIISLEKCFHFFRKKKEKQKNLKLTNFGVELGTLKLFFN